MTVVVAALVLVTVLRLWFGSQLPMWLDETWTAIIVRQPTWTDFWREAWLDCNPPLYYFVMWLAHGVLGEANWGLRLPSVVFVTAAGLLPIFWRPKDMSREASLTWAALICLWWPGVAISLDARGYGMLLFLAVAQAIAFTRLLDEPGPRRALLWGVLAGLAVMTHYYAASAVAAQGLVFLATRRRHWLTLWPAALIGVGVCAQLIYHAPRLAEYARPDVIWYEPTGFVGVVGNFAYALARVQPLFLLLLGGILAITLFRRPTERTSLSLTATSGLVAFALMVLIGLVQPSLTGRYFTPLAPLLLLGVVLIVRNSPTACMAVVALYFAYAINPLDHAARLSHRATYGFQRQSEWLMQARPDQLVFLWDHPAAKIMDKRSLEQLGGFFFDRAGVKVRTTPLLLKAGEDPNAALVHAADGERPVFIWLYHAERGSAAKQFPPRAIRGWHCHLKTNGPVGIVACAPKSAGLTGSPK